MRACWLKDSFLSCRAGIWLQPATPYGGKERGQDGVQKGRGGEGRLLSLHPDPWCVRYTQEECDEKFMHFNRASEEVS